MSSSVFLTPYSHLNIPWSCLYFFNVSAFEKTTFEFLTYPVRRPRWRLVHVIAVSWARGLVNIFNFTGRPLNVLIFQGERGWHYYVKTFANSLHSPSVVVISTLSVFPLLTRWNSRHSTICLKVRACKKVLSYDNNSKPSCYITDSLGMCSYIH